MTKQYFPFDNAQVMEAQWSLMARQWVQSGVFSGLMNEMLVYGDSTGMQVKVKTGGGWVQGHYYSNDAEEILAIQAAHATLNRIDRVILYVDWTNNLVNTGVLTGTPNASPTAPTLTQNTSIWQISLAQVYVGAAVATIAAGNVTDERSFAMNASPDNYQTNNSGGSLIPGSVVVRDLTVTAGFKTTTKVGDPSVCGIVTQNVANGQKTRLQKNGCWPVATTGVITPGHALITSATAGYAQDSGSFQKPLVGFIGFALGGSAGGLSYVLCDVDINVYTSTTVLQQLPTVTIGSVTGTNPQAHTVDSGADGLLVMIANPSSQTQPSAVTWNGTGMTKVDGLSMISSPYCTVTLWSLKNPAIGTYNIVVSGAAGTSGICALNFVGTQATICRTSLNSNNGNAATTSISLSPTSVVSDIVIANLIILATSGWVQGGGQTVIVGDRATGACYHHVSSKPGGAGSTAMSYSGGSDKLAYVAVAIAGS
jgi:hypothetical protein